MPDAETDLIERLNRLEAAVAARPAPPADEQLAQRVLNLLAEKAQQQRALQAANPPVPGLVPVGRVIPNLFSDVPPGTAPLPLPTGAGLKAWFVAQVLGEFRLMAAMYFDPRYRLSRIAQFAVPTILGLCVLNYFLFAGVPQIPILVPIAERAVLIVLAVVLYKVLSREAARYKQVLDYLASYGNFSRPHFGMKK